MDILRHLFGSRRSNPISHNPSSLPTTVLVEQPLGMTTIGEQVELDPEALRKAFFTFIRQATFAEKRTMLHHTPLLLTPAAVTMINEMAQAAQDQQPNLAQEMKFLADLLEKAQEQGIDPALDEWEDAVRNKPSTNLFQQWLSNPTYQDERRFLQHHPEILNDTSETWIQTGLELARQDEQNNPQQQEQVEALHQRLYLFRDIRARVVRLQSLGQISDDEGLTRQAILEGYVNWEGGFMCDLPAWLEKTNQKSRATRRRNKQLSQTAASRAALWQKALKRAQREGLVAEIIAKIAHCIWDALDDITANQLTAQEAGIQHLNLCLQVYTEERYPYQWAKVQNNLGSTYYKRIRGEKADNLEQTITCCSAALCVFNADTLPFEWARTQSNLGHAYVQRIRRDKADNLEQAITYYSTALRIITEDALPSEWADIQNGLGAAYLYRTRGNTADNLEQAITCLTAALRVYTEDALPMDWARAQNNLGYVYWNRIQGDKADNVERAIDYFLAALRVYREDASPMDWALFQNGLGSAYLSRIKGDRANNLEQTIACFSAALHVVTEDALPIQWALTQNNLGNAYVERIQGDKAGNLEQAIACLTAALRVYTEDTFPYEWAKAQQNLGVAYIGRIKGDKADNLQQAIACFFAALRVYSEDAFPLLWAHTQNNLGNAYMERIQGDKTDNLEQAIACFFAALRVYSEDAFPLLWAKAQQNLGVAYIGRIRGDKADNLEQAIAFLTDALRVCTEDDLPLDWARTQNNLGTAYSNRVQGDKADNLEQAIACHNAALCVYTKDALPFEWALMQSNLGASYSERIKGDKSDNLEQAIVCYSAASRVYTKDAWPFEWARIQHGSGLAYHDRIKGDKSGNLEQAIVCYDAALCVYTEDTLPLYHRWTALSYAVTLAERQSWDKAHLAYLSALRAENMLYALAASAKEQDAILVGGRDGSVQDAYSLVRLGRLGEAVVTLEQGRARGLAAARALDMADPQRITDPTRRANFLAKRDVLHQSLIALQQPEERLRAEVSSKQQIETRHLHAGQNARYLTLTARLRQDRAAFNDAVEAIHAAGDPADFLDDPVTETSLLATAQRELAGHAIISLIATPWGGMALGAFSAHPDRHTAARVATLDLPLLSSDAVLKLVLHTLDNPQSKRLGGFVFASEGSIFDVLQNDWADRQRPSWDGTTPLQEWERQDSLRREEALNGVTFKDMAGWLHEICQQQGIDSTLDATCQEVLRKPVFHFSVAKPWNGLTDKQQTLLRGAVQQAFLLREVEHVLVALSDWVMRPLAAWLREEGVMTVTIVPGGYLAAFPILACEIGDGETFAEAFCASVAPSLRSLVLDDHSHRSRSGVATLGNPFPTYQPYQPLYYGQAEALTLAHLGGDPERCRIQEEATKAWLLHCLREAEVVDASCHGAARPDYLQSALYLADDTLSLGDALNQQVADLSGLRLLILSACQTAIPDVRGAENEVRSLAVGMLQAGAQAVMASLWPADDQATYLLIVRFAQEWFPNRRSEPPAAALARAQRWLRHATQEELIHWQASEPLANILETMPDARPEEQRDAFLADIGDLATVRGDEGDPFVEEDWPSDEDALTRDDRSIMDEGQEHIRISATRQTEKDPHAHPYAHPFYWAGFQVTGW